MKADPFPVPCTPVLPDHTQAWATGGRYAGLRVTLLQFLPGVTTWDDPHGQRSDSGFYVCAILSPDAAASPLRDAIPRRHVSLTRPVQS
jgi:hypothetical protein